MNGYKISEAARASGFSEPALRFYEQEGVVVPERTETGYRSYRDQDVEALRFVARAKRLGLSLEEITELLALLEKDECRPVQTRMQQLVTERIGEAHQQVADLIAFTAQLQEAAARLTVHTPDGGCDEGCGCRTNTVPRKDLARKAVALVGSASPPVACTLEPGAIGERIEDWKTTVAQAESRETLPDGVRLRFPRTIDVAALSRLAADEQTCCGFFTFNIGIAGEVIMDVTGAPDAQPAISAMFGAAA